MPGKTSKATQGKTSICVESVDDPGCQLTTIRLSGNVEVRTDGGWLSFWTAGQEVRIGPLTPDQAAKLADDLGYDAVG